MNLKRIFSWKKEEIKKKSTLKTLRERKDELYGGNYPLLGYSDEHLAHDDLDMVDSYTIGTYHRMVSLWDQVRYLDTSGINGSLVECGTYLGGACGMMALSHKRAGVPFRKIHLLDSFLGLPEPDERDGEFAIKTADGKKSGALKPINRCVASLETNKYVMEKIVKYPRELLHYHEGWFQETLPKVISNIDSIAILRLDADWYEATKLCLEYLFPKVVNGGFVIIDDYGHFEGAKRAVDDYFKENNLHYYVCYIDAARFIIKCDNI